MRRSWWRGSTVVLVWATALVVGAPATDLTAPVSLAHVGDTTTTATAPGAGAAVGPLFSGDQHFCTGSVVDSPAGDLVLTAAHCVQDAEDLSFAPGYHDGVAPYGRWTVTRVVVPDGWAATADPGLDFAFLIVRQAGNPRSVQSLTGAERLGTGRGSVNDVTLVGYPDGSDSPVLCRDSTTQESAHQQRIACPGFSDGSSGGPWLTAVDPTSGDGTVLGVIGGFEEGGDTPDVSYSAYFDDDIQRLYDAVAR